MNPPEKLFRNRPQPIQTFQATRKRKSVWETKFEKDYPTIKWISRDLSLKFIIPLEKVKELIEDKPKLIKYIYDKIDLESKDIL